MKRLVEQRQYLPNVEYPLFVFLFAFRLIPCVYLLSVGLLGRLVWLLFPLSSLSRKSSLLSDTFTMYCNCR